MDSVTIKKLFIIVILIITAISFSSIAISDDQAYDEEEAIRRAAKQLDDIDKYEKDQARKRWDATHRSTSDEDEKNVVYICCLCIIFMIIASVKQNKQDKKS